MRYPQLLAGLILAATAASEANYDDLDCLEQLVGKELREVAARVSARQASAEERRRYDEAVLPLKNSSRLSPPHRLYRRKPLRQPPR